MHVRLTPFQYVIAQEQEVLRLTREYLLPLLRQLPGFLSILVAVDQRQPGCGLVLTRWDTAAQAEGLRDALGILAGPFQALGVKLDTARTYEVILQC